MAQVRPNVNDNQTTVCFTLLIGNNRVIVPLPLTGRSLSVGHRCVDSLPSKRPIYKLCPIFTRISAQTQVGPKRTQLLGDPVGHVEERLMRSADVPGRLAGVGSLLTRLLPPAKQRAEHRGLLKPL
jgi:hypothetical protein